MRLLTVLHERYRFFKDAAHHLATLRRGILKVRSADRRHRGVLFLRSCMSELCAVGSKADLQVKDTIEISVGSMGIPAWMDVGATL